jgi:D-alanine-D-alanine ligase
LKQLCCILYNEPAADAGADEMDILDQVALVESQLLTLGIDSVRRGITYNFISELYRVREMAPDFVFNLVESINNQGQLIYFAPALLNLHSVPYTGCPLESIFLTSNKQLALKMMRLGGVPVAGSYRPDEISRLKYGHQYIIKPVWEDGSMGITAGSVITYTPEDATRISQMKPNQWFLEDYIDGREFNISMFTGPSGPVMLPPAEIEFRNYGPDRPRIVDFKAKWDTGSFEYHNTVRVFPGDIKEELLKKLEDACMKCWHLFGLNGYARIDIRTDSKDNVYVLEINANPCISPDSGFIAACQAGGFRIEDVFSNIVMNLNIP